MSQILGWQTVYCTCGRNEFIDLYEVRWHPKLGTSKQTIGSQCCYCKRRLNTASAARELNQRYLEREIDEIQEEIDQLPPREVA